MAMSNTIACNMYDYLSNNFLYNNDINSIHILLNLYDLENNISNIYPKYISVKKLRKHIIRLLRSRKGKHLIASNLGFLIHEDINRLELFLYLEGYKSGYSNKNLTNELEDLTIKHLALNDLYNSKYLFHFNLNIPEIKKLKGNIFNILKDEYKSDSKLNKIMWNYFVKIIKPKILTLNKYLDKQLTIDYNSNHTFIREEETMITWDELNKIYNEVLKVILRNGLTTYCNAFWYGLNDRVLRRYE